MTKILKPTLDNIDQVSVGDTVTLVLDEHADGQLMIDSGATVIAPVVDADDDEGIITDYVVLVKDATGRRSKDGKHYEGRKYRALSEFLGFIIEK